MRKFLLPLSLRTATFLSFGLAALSPTWANTNQTEQAIFGGGCFWCMEEAFEKLPGVESVVSGYSQGELDNPDYRAVSAGGTGHVEVVRVTYDPAKVSYSQLLESFWKNIDPTVKDRQFCDTGDQYRSGIYFLNADQEKAAKASLQALKDSGKFKAIYTEVEVAEPFYMAEEYHQDYYKKNPLRYNFYKTSCGRANRLAEVWGAK